MSHTSLIPGRTDGVAPASGMVGEVRTVKSGAVACNTTSGATVVTDTLTVGEWLVGIQMMADAAVGAVQIDCRLKIKGDAGTTFGDTRIIQGHPDATYATASYPPRKIQILSGDADKSVAVACISGGSTRNVYGVMTSQRIA